MKEDSIMECSEESDSENDAKIIAIGSGKGGVGKTVISASMGVALAKLGFRVVVVDADFGGANLHKVMGCDMPQKTYFHFYHRQYKRLEDICIDHPDIANLRIIIGCGDSVEIANLQYYQRMKCIRHLMELDADFVILDLGAGSGYNVLDFFLTADHGIVLVTPDTLSILDGYNFVKKALYRRLYQMFKIHKKTVELIKKSEGTETHRSPSIVNDLVAQVTKMNKDLGGKMKKCIQDFSPLLLINGTNGTHDESKCLALQVAAENLLSVRMKYLGAVHKDDAVVQSIEENIPFVSYNPKSRASLDLIGIINKKLLSAGKIESVRSKRKIVKTILKEESERNGVVCSVACSYWGVCELKRGGHYCMLQGL